MPGPKPLSAVDLTLIAGAPRASSSPGRCTSAVMAREAPCAMARVTAAPPRPRRPSLAARALGDAVPPRGATNMRPPRVPWFGRVLPWRPVGSWRPQVKMLAFLGVYGAYWLAFPWMLEAWGMAARVLALSYIVLAALLWG